MTVFLGSLKRESKDDAVKSWTVLSPDQAGKHGQKMEVKDRLLRETAGGKFYILNKETKRILTHTLGEQRFVEEEAIPAPGRQAHSCMQQNSSTVVRTCIELFQIIYLGVFGV